MVRITSRFLDIFQKLKSFDFWISSIFWILLLSPLFILVANIRLNASFDADEFLWALKNTISQSFFSAVASVIFGFLGTMGLLAVEPASWYRKALETLALLPNFLPSLFILIFCLSVIEPFPIGLVGIVIVHTFINAGIIMVLWARQLEKVMPALSQLAFLEGASRWQLLRALREPLFGMAWKWILFVFIICFSSFTVPLVVGGGRGTTIEVLIFEKMKISGDLGSALMLSILQGSFVFILAWIFSRNSIHSHRLSFISSVTSMAPRGRMFVLPSIFIFVLYGVLTSAGGVYFFLQILAGWEQVQKISGLQELGLKMIPLTFAIGLMVSFLTLGFLVLQSVLFAGARFHSRVAGLITMSPALIAVAASLIAGELRVGALVFSLVYLFYPSAVRLGLGESLGALEAQQKSAWLMGANSGQILLWITLPNIVSELSFVSAMVGLWAMGDFAVSKIIFSQTQSLGMLAESLMSSYRIDAAFAICGLILGLGVVLFLLLKGMAYVYRQKFS